MVQLPVDKYNDAGRFHFVSLEKENYSWDANIPVQDTAKVSTSVVDHIPIQESLSVYALRK